jgi:lysozyme
MLHGIDIAANNGLTHIPLAKDFGLVKSTESTNYHNPNHPAQAAALRKAGKLVGHYHFLHATVDGAAQAKYFLAHTTINAGDIICVDMEQQSHGVPVGTAAQRVNSALGFLRYIKAVHHCSPFLYSYPDYLRQLVSSRVPLTELRTYPLWIAEYNGKDMVDSADMYGWAVWTMHQNADAPYVDRDVFNGDRSTWAKLAVPHNKPTPPAPPKPVALPTVTITAPKNVTIKVVQ